MDWLNFVYNSIAHTALAGVILVLSVRRYSLRRTVMILGSAAFFLILLELPAAVRGTGVSFGVWALQVAAIQAAAFMVSEFRDFRSLFTGLLGADCVLAGVMIPYFAEPFTRYAAVSVLVSAGIHGAVLWGLWRYFRPVYLEVQLSGAGNWRRWCVVPALFYLSALGIKASLHGTTRPLQALLAVNVFLLTIYASYLLMFWMIRQLCREQQALRDRGIMENGIRALKHELHKFLETEERIEAHVKNRQNMIARMQELMEQKDYGGMKEILMQMAGMTEVSRPVRLCRNPAINGILASYLPEAETEGILLEVELDGLEQLGVNDWELAVVVGNLLDNAICGCRELPADRKRYIKIRMQQLERQLMIEIRNSCRAGIVFNQDTGLPVSHRGKNHGIGMQSVAYFMEKHGAVFDCGVETEQEFFARILI